MINFLWILVIVAAVVSQWYVIEKLRKYPNKPVWFFIRGLVAGGFLYLYIYQGYVWYWALVYMVFTFWWLFNTGLNILRGKELTYLSPKNSLIDKVLLKVFKYEYIIFMFSFILFLASVGIISFYGHCTWTEINSGFCN